MCEYKEVENDEIFSKKLKIEKEINKTHKEEEEDEEEPHNTGEIKKIVIENSKYLNDTSEIEEAMHAFINEANEYIHDIQNEERKNAIIDVTNIIFDTINEHHFDLRSIAIDCNFWSTISDVLLNSPDESVLYQMLICIGVSIEKHPEMIEMPSFDEITPTVLDALDRSAASLVSPAFKIFALSQNKFDNEFWEKIMEFIHWAPEEHILIFHELLCRYARISYEQDAKEWENVERLKIILESINFVLCERNILDGTIDSLLILIKNIGENTSLLMYIIGSDAITFIFSNIDQIPDSYLPGALEIVCKCLLHLTTERHLETILKNKFEAIAEMSESPKVRIQSNAIKIICKLFEDKVILEEYNVEQCMNNIIGYLEEAAFDVKEQAITSLSEAITFIDPELTHSFVENGLVDIMIDVFESDNIETKRNVIDGIRGIVSNSPQPIDTVMEHLDFLLEIYHTDEVIESRIYFIFSIVGYNPEEDDDGD